MVKFTECFLCCRSWTQACNVRLAPLTAGYRILELDRGGVRGIIQLITLAYIEEAVGLPLQIFFDLAVGTSVGKYRILQRGLMN